MKVTIELESEMDWQACGGNLRNLASVCLRWIPGRPTVIVKVSARANELFSDTNGNAVLSDMVLTVTPKTKM